jgi:hypothetical protein
MPNTKIELNHNQVSRVQGVDDFASIIFPNNKDHQKIFLAIFIELKYATDQFLPSLVFIGEKYHVSRRVLETVRSKMRRMGLIDHVSRFNKRYGYREGWIFSTRFRKACMRLADCPLVFRQRMEPNQERKDRDLFRYL